MGFGDSCSTFFRRMPWFLQYYILLLPLAMSMVAVVDSGRKLPPIYWNSTNSMFYTSSRNNEIDINLNDNIDIICPRYPPGTRVENMEYYVIYMVNKTAYDTCIINDTSMFRMVVNCSYPFSNVTYTLLIKAFQSIPGNPDFEAGMKYYFITTSRGALHEVDNQYLGACRNRNMRLILNVKVCCGDNQTPKPTTIGPDGTPETPPKTTPRPPVTTRRPTTTKTTTTSTTTTTMRATTLRPHKPTYTDRIPGKGTIPDENVIHANGPKNVGFINDNAGCRTLLSMATLLVSLLLAYLLR